MSATASMPDLRPSDVLVRCERSIYLFAPMTGAARQWLLDNTDAEWIGEYAAVVEHRYVGALVEDMTQAGLIVRLA